MMYEEKTSFLSLRNQDWKTVKAEIEKNKRIINTYPNEQHHRIKRTNLYKRKISLLKSEFPERTQTKTQNLNRELDWKHR